MAYAVRNLQSQVPENDVAGFGTWMQVENEQSAREDPCWRIMGANMQITPYAA
jgi:transcription elongation GreA/GreB family factor